MFITFTYTLSLYRFLDESLTMKKSLRAWKDVDHLIPIFSPKLKTKSQLHDLRLQFWTVKGLFY